MKHNKESLIQESLKNENDFSSTTHAIDTLTKDSPKGIKEYPIPSRYYKDRITLLPVNLSKYYLYWEITQETLEAHGIDLHHQKLYFQLHDSNGQMLYEFESAFALGDYFVKKLFENRDIYAKVGYKTDEQFIELQSSKTIHTFSSSINLPSAQNEIWMRKEKYWSEIIHSTLQGMHNLGSSEKYLQEMQRLQYFLQKSAQSDLNSSTLHKGVHHD